MIVDIDRLGSTDAEGVVACIALEHFVGREADRAIGRVFDIGIRSVDLPSGVAGEADELICRRATDEPIDAAELVADRRKHLNGRAREPGRSRQQQVRRNGRCPTAEIDRIDSAAAVDGVRGLAGQRDRVREREAIVTIAARQIPDVIDEHVDRVVAVAAIDSDDPQIGAAIGIIKVDRVRIADAVDLQLRLLLELDRHEGVVEVHSREVLDAVHKVDRVGCRRALNGELIERLPIVDLIGAGRSEAVKRDRLHDAIDRRRDCSLRRTRSDGKQTRGRRSRCWLAAEQSQLVVARAGIGREVPLGSARKLDLNDVVVVARVEQLRSGLRSEAGTRMQEDFVDPVARQNVAADRTGCLDIDNVVAAETADRAGQCGVNQERVRRAAARQVLVAGERQNAARRVVAIGVGQFDEPCGVEVLASDRVCRRTAGDRVDSRESG